MTKHADQVKAHLHVAAYTVADAAARTALAATLTAAQVSLLVYQEDTDVMYVCTAAATLAELSAAASVVVAHKTQHQDGGSDEISVTDLSGLLADEQTPLDHDHTGDAGDGGQLEADLALLATGDAATKVLTPDGANAVQWSDVPVHVSRHENGGADEISVADLSGLLADEQTPVDHDHTGDAGDGGQLEADLALTATGDTANHIVAADGANGIKIANPGSIYYTWFQVMFSVEGELIVANNPLRVYAPVALTIDKVYIAVGTVPTGASVIVDVNKNGTTIFTTQGNRPEIAISANTDESGTPDVTALAAGDYLTIDIDQVGSGDPGEDLTVHVRCKQYLSF